MSLAVSISALMLTCFTGAFAASAGTLTNTPFDAEQGEQFSTIVYMRSGSGIVDFQTELFYDTENLELISAERVSGLVGNMEIGTEKPGVISVNYTRVSSNMTSETQLLQLTFRVDNNLSDGLHEFLGYNADATEAHSLNNYSLEDASLTCSFGKLSLYGSGDVNMDNKVSIADATYVRQYLVSMRDLSDIQLAKANTIGNDATVDIADAVRIQQKLIYDELILGDRANVTFYVDGEVYAVKSVKIGEDLTNIPAVPHKELYSDGAWDVTDFTGIASSVSVNAVYGYTGQTEAGKATYQKVLTALDTGFVQSGKYIADNFQLPYKNTYGTFNMLSSSEFKDVDILWSIDSGLLAQSVVIGNDYVVTVPELDYTTSVTFTAYVYIDGVLYGTHAFDREIKGKIDLPNSNTFKDIIDAIPTYDVADAPKLGLVDANSKVWKDELSKKYSSYESYFLQNMENYRLPGSVSLESDRTNYGVKIVQDVDIVWTLKDGDPKGFDASKNRLIYLKDENPVTLKASFMFDGYCVYSQTITRTVPAKPISEQVEYAEDYLAKYVPGLLSGEALFPYQIELYDLTVTWASGSASGKFTFGSNVEYKDLFYTPIGVGPRAGYMEWGTLIARVERNGDSGFRAVEIEYPIQLAGDSTEITRERIADVNLYKALLKIFDTKYGNDDGILTEEEIYDTEVAEKLDYKIDLSNLNIEDLAGIDYLVRYRSLNLSGNKLGGTNAHLARLAGLTNLEQLNLSNCGISEIPPQVFASMYAIEGIDLSYNDLEDLDFLDQGRAFTELTDLFVQGNDVSDISALSYTNGRGEVVSTTPNVKRLTLSRKLDSKTGIVRKKSFRVDRENSKIIIDGVAFNATMDLSSLDLEGEEYFIFDSDNNITGVDKAMDITPIGLMKNLNVLWLANSKIENITPIGRCSLLTTLDLSNNRISAPNASNDGLYPLSNLQSLICLMLDDNDITTVRSLRKLTNLQELSLSNNKIGSVDALSPLRKLSYIDLDKNNLTAFNAGTFTKLNFLYLEDNDIEQLVSISDAKNLYQLRLSYNNLSNPEIYAEIGKLEKLYYLSLSGNKIGSLEFLKNLKGLQQLEIDSAAVYQYYNAVDENGEKIVCDNLDYLSGLVNLKILDISQNDDITSITALAPLTGLNALYMDGIHLEHWEPLSRMTGLKYLSMQNSGVTDLDFASSLTGLVYFNASGHSAPAINFNSFRYYENIEQLFLDSAVECQPTNILTGLTNATNIRMLSLRNINVERIENLPDMDTLEYLNLQNTGITDFEGPDNGVDGHIYSIDRFMNLKALFVRENEELFTHDNLNALYRFANKDRVGNERETPIDVYLYTPDDLPYDVFCHADHTDEEGKTTTYMAYRGDGLEHPENGKYYEDYVWGTFDADVEIGKIKPNIEFAKQNTDISDAVITSAEQEGEKGYALPTIVNGFDIEWSMENVLGCYIKNGKLYYNRTIAGDIIDLHITATVKDLYGSDYPIHYDVTVDYGSNTLSEISEEENLDGMSPVEIIDETYSDYGEWQDAEDENGKCKQERTVYRYYYIPCPSCGDRMGIYGHSSSDSRVKTVQCKHCGYQTQMGAFKLVERWSTLTYDEAELAVLNAEAEYTFKLGDVWFVDRFDELSGVNEKKQYRYKRILTPKKYVYERQISNGLMLIVDGAEPEPEAELLSVSLFGLTEAEDEEVLRENDDAIPEEDAPGEDILDESIQDADESDGQDAAAESDVTEEDNIEEAEE